MNLSEVIKKRRSVRKYDPSKDVNNNDIKKILEAGRLAPSSGNSQPTRFYVVRDKDLKRKIATEAGHQDFLLDVPVIIVVCVDLDISSSYGRRGKETYSLQDSAAAIENILLTITDIGLASCWIGSFDEEKAAKILELDNNLRPAALIPIGYGLEEPSVPPRQPIENITEWR